MTNEEMQSTIQFLLEQQAHYAARAEMDVERITRVENAVTGIREVLGLLTQVARNADERIDNFDARLEAQQAAFEARRNADQQVFEARMNADREDFNARMSALDERLNILISVVEQHITHGHGGTA